MTLGAVAELLMTHSRCHPLTHLDAILVTGQAGGGRELIDGMRNRGGSAFVSAVSCAILDRRENHLVGLGHLFEKARLRKLQFFDRLLGEWIIPKGS